MLQQPIEHNQNNLLLSFEIRKIFHIFVVMTTCLASIRGIIVLNTNSSPKLVYPAVALTMLGLAGLGFIFSKTTDRLIALKNIFKINLLLGVVYSITRIVSGSSFEIPILYVFFAPYIVFVYLKIPKNYLKWTVVIITLLLSYSIIVNFYCTQDPLLGDAYLYEYSLRLRPDLYGAISRTGRFLRPIGYTANYHDSANILGMAVSYFFISFLEKRSLMDLGIFLVAIVSLTLTQSAANIILAILTLIAFSISSLVLNKKGIKLIYFFLGGISLLALIYLYGDVMSIFLVRVGPDGDWQGMLNQLNINSLITSLPILLLGHAQLFSSDIIKIEAALLKLVFELGIISAITLYFLLLYPVIYFIKKRININTLPSIAAVFFGFISLLHYGSLFRVTSIFLFYVFFTLCLKEFSEAEIGGQLL